MITTVRALIPGELELQQFTPGRPLLALGARDDAVRVRCTVADVPALIGAATGVRLFVELDVTGLATGPAVDVAALAESGVLELALVTDAPLGAVGSLGLLTLLRDAMEHGVFVRWPTSLVTPGLVDEADLVHLQPPADARPDWLELHRYAQLYWRKGPNFVSIVDKRDETQTRYVLDEPELLALFDALVVPVRVSSLPDDWRTQMRDLLDAHLAVQVDDWVTRLPYRLRRWPMPSEGV